MSKNKMKELVAKYICVITKVITIVILTIPNCARLFRVPLILIGKIQPFKLKHYYKKIIEGITKHSGWIYKTSSIYRFSYKPYIWGIVSRLCDTLITNRFKREKHSVIDGVWIPTVITLSVTGRCNMHCEYCYADRFNKEDIDLTLLNNFISESEILGTSLFLISGGEPWLYEGLIEIPKNHLKSLFAVFTNGILLNDKIIRETARYKNTIHVISVHLKKTNDKNYELSAHINEKRQIFDKYRIPCIYQFVVTNENLYWLLDEKNISVLDNKETLAFLFIKYSGTDQNYVIPTRSLEYFNCKLKKLRASLSKPVLNLPEDEITANNWCPAGRTYAHMTPSGFVEGCPHLMGAVGNIKEKKPYELFKLISNGGRNKKMRLAAPCLCKPLEEKSVFYNEICNKQI